MITFTTTATVRPELIEATYSNFSQNLKGINLKQCELIINVDPIPADSLFQKPKIIEIAQKYFGTVTYNFPETPNFPMALRWVWSNTKTQYVFNLEDDWRLSTRVEVPQLIQMLEQSPGAIGVSLNAYLFASNPYRIRLSPGLFRGDWVREAAQHIQPSRCPEKQLRTRIPVELVKPMLNFPEYKVSKLGKIIVFDTGREWRERRGLIKNNQNDNVGFTTWKKKR
jgi:hypothetical protein